jgi:hypothetical protein
MEMEVTYITESLTTSFATDNSIFEYENPIAAELDELSDMFAVKAFEETNALGLLPEANTSDQFT